jgi:hypothetical protein
MFIRDDGDELVLVRTFPGEENRPEEVVLARLGQDAELNLFHAAETGRRTHPEHWRDISDFDVLQALENFKRRIGHMKPALVAIQGGRTDREDADE